MTVGFSKTEMFRSFLRNFTQYAFPRRLFSDPKMRDLEWPLNAIQGVLCSLAPGASESTRLPCLSNFIVHKHSLSTYCKIQNQYVSKFTAASRSSTCDSTAFLFPYMIAWRNASSYISALLGRVNTRQLSYRKDDLSMHPCLWVPWKFSTRRVGLTPTATFPEIFNGLLFCSGRSHEYVQNLKFVALPVRYSKNLVQKFGQSLDTHPRSLFSKIFNGLFFGCTPAFGLRRANVFS